jgi:hypothetical protein
MDEKVRSLRTNNLKHHREMREAAVFCHGMGTVLNRTIYFAPCEEEGHDFIMMQRRGDEILFSPLQIKELVPESVNPHASLEGILDGLKKYAAASDTVVAIHMNRRLERMDIKKLDIPNVKVGQIWLFGGVDEVPNGFVLCGDLLDQPEAYRFDLP